MKQITTWLRTLFRRRPTFPYELLHWTPASHTPTPPPTEAEPHIPMTEAERMAAGDAARAARAIELAAQVRVNQFEDPPEVCAARAADPVWRAEQVAKREAASEAFVRYRNEKSGLPLRVKERY